MREIYMATTDYRPEGRILAHNQAGEARWVLVHQLWFEIDAVPEGRNRWQASGIRRYRLSDGGEVVALDAKRLVVSATGEQLQRSDVHSASSTSSHCPTPMRWPPTNGHSTSA
jgi:hypothetical protein